MNAIPVDVSNAYAEHIVDELVYRSYRHQRETAPEISPERWARVFTNVTAMEARYQKEIEFVRNPFAVHGISVEAYNDHIFGSRD